MWFKVIIKDQVFNLKPIEIGSDKEATIIFPDGSRKKASDLTMPDMEILGGKMIAVGKGNTDPNFDVTPFRTNTKIYDSRTQKGYEENKEDYFDFIKLEKFPDKKYLSLIKEYWNANFFQLKYSGPITYILWIQSEKSITEDIVVYLETINENLTPHLIIGNSPIQGLPSSITVLINSGMLEDKNMKFGEFMKEMNLTPEQKQNILSVFNNLMSILGMTAKRMDEGFQGSLNPDSTVKYQEQSKFFKYHSPISVQQPVTTKEVLNSQESMIICPHCNTEIIAGQKFCVQCGKPISTTQKRVICIHCNATLTENEKFCGNCGQLTQKEKISSSDIKTTLDVKRTIPHDNYPSSPIEKEIPTYLDEMGMRVVGEKPIYRTPTYSPQFAETTFNFAQNPPSTLNPNWSAQDLMQESKLIQIYRDKGMDFDMNTFNKFIKTVVEVIKEEPSLPKDLSLYEFFKLAQATVTLLMGKVWDYKMDSKEAVSILMRRGWLDPKLEAPHLTLPGLIFRELFYLGNMGNMRWTMFAPVMPQMQSMKLLDVKNFSFQMGTKPGYNQPIQSSSSYTGQQYNPYRNNINEVRQKQKIETREKRTKYRKEYKEKNKKSVKKKTIPIIATALIILGALIGTQVYNNHASIDLSSSFYDMDSSGDYLYVVEFGEMEIFDIQDPSYPILISTMDQINSYSTSAISVDGSHAYIATEADGLIIVDISDPNNPTLETQSWGVDYCIDIQVLGNYMYLHSSDGGGSKLEIYDVSDPSNPTFVSDYSNYDDIYNMEIIQDYAFLNYNYEIHIVDISNPNSPTFIQTIEKGSDIFTISGDYLHMQDFSEYYIFDISDPTMPIEVGHTVLPNYIPKYAKDICIEKDTAYICSQADGIYMVDISDVMNPTVYDSTDILGGGDCLIVKNDIIYTASHFGDQKMYLIDVNNHLSIQDSRILRNSSTIPILSIIILIIFNKRKRSKWVNKQILEENNNLTNSTNT